MAADGATEPALEGCDRSGESQHEHEHDTAAAAPAAAGHTASDTQLFVTARDYADAADTHTLGTSVVPANGLQARTVLWSAAASGGDDAVISARIQRAPLLKTAPSSLPHCDAPPTSTSDSCTTDVGRGPASASFVSRLFFSYTTPLMRVGNARQLHLSDMWELEHDNTVNAAFDAFNEQFVKRNRSVARAMVATYGLSFLACGLAALFSAACAVFTPAVLNHIVNAFAAPEIDVADVMLWLGAFFASRLLNAVVTAQMSFYLQLFSLRLTVALKSLLFRKAVRRSEQSKSDAAAVDISNLYTSDVNNILMAAPQVNNIWILPIQIGVVAFMLYHVIGLAAFAGIAIIIASMFVSFLIATRTGKAFKSIMQCKDARMRVVKEAFGAIQIVKLSAWETQFADKIRERRAWELTAVAQYLFWFAMSVVMLWASPIFVSIASFAVYALAMEQQLTAAKVFTAIALFNAIRDPLRDLPSIVQQCIQAKVSLSRMTEYLALPEFEPANVAHEDALQSKDVLIAIKNGAFGWSTDVPALLQDVNLSVKRGDLVVVHGAVGAGKSTLCAALLGEAQRLSGTVSVRGTMAYYSQQTWIQHRSIRENILFGNAFDACKYATVLDACGLVSDLAGFPAGDATEIGQKGVNLSGGQKARLCLARACYSDADLLILDSPLAAVDAVVQSEIFGKCICTLLARKTVVLVTHSPDIIASKVANVKVLVHGGTLTAERKEVVQPRSVYTPTLPSLQVQKAQVHRREDREATDAGRLVDVEERSRGRVSKAVLRQYFSALGGAKVGVVVLLALGAWQALQIGSDVWLSYWTDQEPGTYTREETKHNLTVNALLGAGAALMVFMRTLMTYASGWRATRHLFSAMTKSLLRAPLRVFDTTPIGRIVNRYSDDVSVLDLTLPIAIGGFLSKLFFTTCQLAMAMYSVNFLGALILPLVYLCVRVANFYLSPSREIARLVKVAASPVLSHVSESEDGVVAIRAFGSAYIERAVTENLERLDANSRAWFVMTAARQWFLLRIQLLVCVVVMLVVLSLVYLRDIVTPGVVGLAFTYVMGVDGRLLLLVQTWSLLELSLVSPERVIEYINIPAEGSSKALVIEPSEQWPQRGSIRFEDVVFSYKPGAPAVLKGLSFDINAGEKVGIVGRTGAGKSSLTMALFRINELDAGRIVIDGEDISRLPLRTLRSRLSIVPQAPVLFKGSLRAYMDPFDDFSDAQIWAALHKAGMKEQIAALEHQLSFELGENGENFSVGERQMLCMARALLKQSRIVVMDEATASIDHATETKLQSMIAREFQHATVVTIAHRLATVLDSDRILVLRDGQVVEFDSPRELVQDSSGVFYELAKEGGYLGALQQ